MSRPFQFSIAALLAYATAVAVIAGFMFVVRVGHALPTLMVSLHVTAGLLAVAAAFGGRQLRAFAIGALVPLAICIFGVSDHVLIVINWRDMTILDDNSAAGLVLGNLQEMHENVRAYIGFAMLAALHVAVISVFLEHLLQPDAAKVPK